MASLQDEILKLINPTPVFKDPEANDDDTVAKLVSKDDTLPDEPQQPSHLRRKAAALLLDSDKRYAGKQTSRKNLKSDGDTSEDDDESTDASSDGNYDDISRKILDKYDLDGSSDGDDSEEVEEEEDDETDIAAYKAALAKKKDTEFSFTDDGDYSKYADDDEGSDDNDDDDDDGSDDDSDDDSDNDSSGGESDEDLDEELDEEENNEQGSTVQTMTTAGADDVAKGVAAKQQLSLWDSVLESRIQLQQVFSLINQLPQHHTWSHFSQHSQFQEQAAKSEGALTQLLASLVQLQDALLAQNSDTRPLLDPSKQNLSAKDDDSDEEIPSDTEDEEEKEKKSEEKQDSPRPRKRKLKLDEYPGFLKRRNDSFMTFRNSTIQKWYDKTRLAGGRLKGKSFEAFDQSVLVQINQILGDEERLLKRTQLKRSVYRVLGSTSVTMATGEEAMSETAQGPVKEYDEEVFDDDDFYHQLLRELIERKTTDVNDPIALSRQWLQIQKLRTKNKKFVDTKASKGRKLRYDVHKKLVNFMAPLDNSTWSQEARDDLFKSLFGRLSTSVS